MYLEFPMENKTLSLDQENRQGKPQPPVQNGWERTITQNDLIIKKMFEGLTSPENRFLLEKLGEVRGKRLLDLGSRTGEASVYFSKKGAHCHAVDASPDMIKTSLKLAALHNREVQGTIMNAHALDFPDKSFDIVYSASFNPQDDPGKILEEIHRVLAPDGTFCFWSPLKHNPLVNRFQKTPGLDFDFLQTIQEKFSTVQFDTFWYLTLGIFWKIFLWEKAGPSHEDPLRKLTLEEGGKGQIYTRLERLDRSIKKIPFLRKYAWTVAVAASKGL